VKVTLWGTRGSLPSAGPENVRYGGNTSCVEVRGADGTLLVLDAGTGIRRLGVSIPDDLERVDILLTHLHMDHIQGLGFFQPLYRPDLEVHIWGPPSTGLDLGRRLTKYLSPPLFPVPLRDLPCRLSLHDVPLDPFEVKGLRLRADLVCHPGPTAGYRVTENGTSLAYLPDHEPALASPGFPAEPEWTSGFDLAAGADLLIHDSQYTLAEYTEHVGWGHSAIPHTLAFAGFARVKRLVTFHHDPGHSDAMLDRLVDEARQICPLSFELIPGTEGTTLRLAG
jgi:phosphoribosyl 1,2-cyclic phosphodiesterase